MNYKMAKPNRYFLISPYVFSLSCFAFIVMVSMLTLCCYFIYASNSDSQCYFFLAFIFFVYIGACIYDSYEFFGVAKLTESELIVMAPFRKALRFPYVEIKDIGIDYGYLSVGIQFWIYIGKEIVPAKYCHRINRLPFGKQYVRIQYSPKIFDALHKCLPDSMKKRFNNSQTTLRIFKE